MTDGTKTSRALEGRKKALRWRSIPTTETQETQVIDWEPVNEAEPANEADEAID